MADRVLPFYAVCDESYSMVDHIGMLGDALRELPGRLAADPGAAGVIHFRVIGFAEQARVITPPSLLGDHTTDSGISPEPATNFGAAFIMLRDIIQRDLAALTGTARRIHRPTVFFLSDGRPTDQASWPAAYARLIDPAWAARPAIVAFGIGDADPATISRIGTAGSFRCDHATTPSQALERFTETLLNSMLRAATGEGRAGLPHRVDGFTALTCGPG